MSGKTRISDISRPDREPLVHLDANDLMPLPAPLDVVSGLPPLAPLSGQARERYEGLDDTCAVSIPQPKTPGGGARAGREVPLRPRQALPGENNWTFLQPLLLTMEHCAKCQTCSEACHIYEASGEDEIYRPTYRSEIMRRLYFKHVRNGGLLSAWQHGDDHA